MSAPVASAKDSSVQLTGPVFYECNGDDLAVYTLDVVTGETSDLGVFPGYDSNTNAKCMRDEPGIEGRGLRSIFDSGYTRAAVDLTGGDVGYVDAETGDTVNVSKVRSTDDPFSSPSRFKDAVFDADDNMLAYDLETRQWMTLDPATGAVLSSDSDYPTYFRLPTASPDCSVEWQVGDTNTYIRQSNRTFSKSDGWLTKWTSPVALPGNELILDDTGCDPTASERVSPVSENPFLDVASDPSGSTVIFQIQNQRGGGGTRWFAVDVNNPDRATEIIPAPNGRGVQSRVIDWL